MTISATQYLFKASIPTSTVTATVGAYTVPASTRGQVVAVTIANTSTTNLTTYADVALFDGSVAYPVVTRATIYPGGNLIVEGVAKHVLPTGGAVYVTGYATFISAVMTVVELATS